MLEILLSNDIVIKPIRMLIYFLDRKALLGQGGGWDLSWFYFGKIETNFQLSFQINRDSLGPVHSHPPEYEL